MRFHDILASWTAFAAVSHGLNILITNEDGFATSHIRELYKQLKALGHICFIVAPVTDQSHASHVPFTTSGTLTEDGEWGAVKAGSPSIGTDLSDDHIWYYNGTSAAQVLVALDYVLPTFAPFHKPDLVVYGPNFGWTLGPLPYTFSDNLGPAIVAIERGIPAIAFSTGNPVSALYTWVNDTTEVNLPDPATVTARLASRLIQTMYSKAEGKPFLPQGYGISVNMPFITTFTSDTCIDPPFVLVRSTGTATDTVKYDSNTGLFESTLVGGGAATTEHGIVNTNCTSLITAFTVQYDGSHGQCINATDASTLLVPVVIQLNNTAPGKGSGGSVVVVGNSTDPKGVPSAVQPPMGIPGLGVKNQWSLGLLMVCFGVAAFLL